MVVGADQGPRGHVRVAGVDGAVAVSRDGPGRERVPGVPVPSEVSCVGPRGEAGHWGVTGVVATVTVLLLLPGPHRHAGVVGRDGGVRGVGRHRVLGRLHAGVGTWERGLGVLVAHHRGGGRAAFGWSWKTGEWLLLDDGSHTTPTDGLVLVDHGVEVLDVVHGRGEDLHPTDLLLAGSSGDGRP